MKISDIRPEVYALAEETETRLRSEFDQIDLIARINTQKVMEAFQDNRVSEACFAGTTGYGYDDLGRDTLDKIYAQIFRTEAALVRTGFVNGTHALTAATGVPYDTLRCAIGISGEHHGSLKFYGVGYSQVELASDGGPDLNAIRCAAADPKVRAVMIQRSRGYEDRRALTVEEIGAICATVRAVNPSVVKRARKCSTSTSSVSLFYPMHLI